MSGSLQSLPNKATVPASMQSRAVTTVAVPSCLWEVCKQMSSSVTQQEKTHLVSYYYELGIVLSV